MPSEPRYEVVDEMVEQRIAEAPFCQAGNRAQPWEVNPGENNRDEEERT